MKNSLIAMKFRTDMVLHFQAFNVIYVEIPFIYVMDHGIFAKNVIMILVMNVQNSNSLNLKIKMKTNLVYP